MSSLTVQQMSRSIFDTKKVAISMCFGYLCKSLRKPLRKRLHFLYHLKKPSDKSMERLASMDFFNELGPLALVSRLRRLTERITQDVVNIYKEFNIDFEPRWFPVFYLLSRKGSLSIMEIASILGISHPAVNQIAAELVRHGLVKSMKHETDKRKRMLTLTAAGRELLPTLEAIWDGVHIAAKEMLYETGEDVLAVIQKMEAALDREPILSRYAAYEKARQLDAVEVVEYQPAYRNAFRDLNIEWIEKYFRVEPEDERVLSDPEKEILASGGKIFFARPAVGDEKESLEAILGTCALVKKGERVYELAKMAVTEKAQGRQIGKKLLKASIAKAREMDAETVILETNSRLTPAINLYRKLGFVLIPPDPNSKYDRSDTRMRLDLA
jgi:DNA-binding MarR family transcriptional regulator/ribosomal protein S18 acetylase RimI-like enzyme